MNSQNLKANDGRENGIINSANNADLSYQNWGQEAYQILVQFLKQHKGEFFMEDVRKFAANLSFEIPPSQRAWGHVILQASRNNIVMKLGYSRKNHPDSHGTVAVLWKSAN